MYGLFREEHWDMYIFMFDKCGMEAYESMERVYVAKNLLEEIGAPERTRTRFYEAIELIRYRFFVMEEEVRSKMGEEKAENTLNGWIDGIMQSSDPLLRRAGGVVIQEQPQAFQQFGKDIQYRDEMLYQQLGEADYFGESLGSRYWDEDEEEERQDPEEMEG